MLLASILVVGATALSMWTVGSGLWLNQRAVRLNTEYDSELIWTQQTLKLAQTLQKLAEAQEITETTVHGTTTVVQAVHKGISRIPFGILEAIPATRDSTRAVRISHDAISETVYSTIKGANRLLGEAARKAIKPPSDGETPKKLPPSE